MTTPFEQVAALLVQRDQMLQIIGALVDRTGGTEVVILAAELLQDRRVAVGPVTGAIGALRVTAKRE